MSKQMTEALGNLAHRRRVLQGCIARGADTEIARHMYERAYKETFNMPYTPPSNGGVGHDVDCAPMMVTKRGLQRCSKVRPSARQRRAA